MTRKPALICRTCDQPTDRLMGPTHSWCPSCYNKMKGVEVISSPEEARARAEQIRANAENVGRLLLKAWHARDWVTLGYTDMADYWRNEFKGTVIAKPQRGEVAFTLRHAGMSLRAIEAATGIDKDTVRRVARGVSNETPATVTGLDGKTYQATSSTATNGHRPADPVNLALAAIDEFVVNVHDALETGIDQDAVNRLGAAITRATEALNEARFQLL